MKEMSIEELEEILENNPYLKSQLEEIAIGEKELKDPRLPKSNKKPYLNFIATICPICDNIVEDTGLMEWNERLSAFTRTKRAKKEDFPNLEIRQNVYVHRSFTPCECCSKRLEFFSKNELIKRMLFTFEEREMHCLKLHKSYLNGELKKEE